MNVNLEEMARTLPPEAQPVLRENGFMEPDRLQVGDAAPPLRLVRREDGAPVEVGGPGATRPTVLIFGSYT